MLPELHKIHREDKDKYISTYQKYNTYLEELLKLDSESNPAEIDKAWTALNPEK